MPQRWRYNSIPVRHDAEVRIGVFAQGTTNRRERLVCAEPVPVVVLLLVTQAGHPIRFMGPLHWQCVVTQCCDDRLN